MPRSRGAFPKRLGRIEKSALDHFHDSPRREQLSNVSCPSLRLVRACWIPIRTWCEANITWYSRWVFLGADITCPVSAIEWIQGNRNWKICKERCLRRNERGVLISNTANTCTVKSKLFKTNRLYFFHGVHTYGSYK